MRNIKTTLTAIGLGAAMLTTMSTESEAGCSETIYTGTVCFMAADFCPRGFIKAEGQIIPISSQSALYALLGTNFGGNGSSTMGIPELRGRAPVGYGLGISMQTTITMGLQRGVQMASIGANQLAPHSHSYNLDGLTVTGKIKVSDATGTLGTPQGNYLAGSSVGASPQYKKTGTTVPMGSTVLGSIDASDITGTTITGAGQPYPNQGPRLGLTACIADSTNLFPPRT
ncbi:tail fiber protein [Terasakiella sp. A23]|uniref:phage tail protein n=1 Tax=Terasakiella sp. FCG-A23 TaxID=3080561 RepID=UPI002954D705|nr:tail fiber protein [Terasakiella sp. A23]MDV7340349.1 tail fiber protein [Terasakiella sp. A23]